MRSSILAISALSLANAESTLSLRRRLSFEKVAGYAPGSQVRQSNNDNDDVAIIVTIDSLPYFLTITLFP
jgi:hypothetical protein